MAHHLVKRLNLKQWQVSLVDASDNHYYQPGFLFVPFGVYEEDDILRRMETLLPRNLLWVKKHAQEIKPDRNTVSFADGSELRYDILIVATGSTIAPSETKGMEGPGWRESIFDFYSPEGAKALRPALQKFSGGDLVIHITEMPIKCPVAPLEFAFLADWYLTRAGLRARTKITYLTPLSGAFTKPVASKALGHLLEQKGIRVVPEFNVERIDGQKKSIASYDGTEIPYDLLVTVPTNMGDSLLERSGLGDELNFVPVHKHTLQSKAKDNIFVIGDATDAPTSKAGSVAHFQAEVLVENLLRYIDGRALEESFDGHANCFIESGFKKGLLIDFNYDHEPVPGRFPLAGIGPLSLLKENRVNHWGKLAFRWIYWNLLLKARKIPAVSAQMKMSGKRFS